MSAFSDFGVPGLILCRPIDAYVVLGRGKPAEAVHDQQGDQHNQKTDISAIAWCSADRDRC